MVGFLPLQPMFRVQGRERTHPERTIAFEFTDPEFRLVPTASFYRCVICGVAVTLAPMMSRCKIAGYALAAFLAVAAISQLLHCLSLRAERDRLGLRSRFLPSGDALRHSTVSVGCLLPTSILCFLAAGGSTATTTAALATLWPVVPAVALMSIWIVGAWWWMCSSRAFQVHELESAYRSVSHTIREKITQTTRMAHPAPAQSWRSMPNMAHEVHLFGLSASLFQTESGGLVWKKGLRALLWYYAPVSVPLAILILLPPTYIALASIASELEAPYKHELAMATLAWVSWAMPYVLIRSEIDFTSVRRREEGSPARSEVDVFSLGHADNRRVLSQYITGSGLVAMEAVVAVLAPSLMGYIDLFPAPDFPKHTETRVSANAEGIPYAKTPAAAIKESASK